MRKRRNELQANCNQNCPSLPSKTTRFAALSSESVYEGLLTSYSVARCDQASEGTHCRRAEKSTVQKRHSKRKREHKVCKRPSLLEKTLGYRTWRAYCAAHTPGKTARWEQVTKIICHPSQTWQIVTDTWKRFGVPRAGLLVNFTNAPKTWGLRNSAERPHRE